MYVPGRTEVESRASQRQRESS